MQSPTHHHSTFADGLLNAFDRFTTSNETFCCVINPAFIADTLECLAYISRAFSSIRQCVVVSLGYGDKGLKPEMAQLTSCVVEAFLLIGCRNSLKL